MSGAAIFALFLLVPWALVVGALVLDLRTGKGIGLGLLALLLLLALITVTVGVAGVAVNPQVLHPTGNAGGLEVVFLWLLLLACTYLVWVVEIGALVEASRAGQRGWVWAIGVVMFIQVVLAVYPLAVLVWMGVFGILALLIASTATVLVYCVLRTVRPRLAASGKRNA